MADLKGIRCFVFDMDGTVNLGNTLIDGAKELIDFLSENAVKYFFFTNNSSKAPDDYVSKLLALGFSGITRRHVVTSGDVMIHYLKTRFSDPSVYLAGTPELERQFEGSGIRLLGHGAKSADAVVIGFDTSFYYEKANTACRLIAGGAPFLATNIDRVCPLEAGAFLPDCGSICQMIRHATGVEPTFVGKPFKPTVDYILNAAGTAPEKTAMVGDRLYTDIATALNGGIVGIAVLSGEISQHDIDRSDIKPHFTFDSVKQIYETLKDGGN